jgi:signal transduction histidine kinase
MLSHHIKNILQGIGGGGYMIEQGLAKHDEDGVRRGWALVDKNQGKISTLVMDMLTFSKDREPDPEPGDINRVVGEVVELAQARGRDLGVTVDWQPGEGIPVICFDPEGIHRAVLNIAGNAVDACDDREDGRVTISTEYHADEGLVRIYVEDNGVGIPHEDLDKIFTLFVSNKGSRGTGLGLPVSQKILKEHGGDIHVASTVGQGSRFTLELPATTSNTLNDAPNPEVARTGEMKRGG